MQQNTHLETPKLKYSEEGTAPSTDPFPTGRGTPTPMCLHSQPQAHKSDKKYENSHSAQELAE